MKNRLKPWLWFLLLTLLSVPAGWLLTTAPFFESDDGVLHLFRTAALDDAIRQGILYPRLFPSFAFGYGHAILSYYGPLGYYAALIPHWLGADYAAAVKWTFGLGYTFSGWSAYVLARRFAPPPAALAGAVIYMYFPYHLMETYQRGAFAEHLAWIFLPLILWLCTPLLANGASAWRGLLLALCLAALIVTHNLTALMFLPFVPAYYWFVSTPIPPRRRIAFITLSLVGALALSMFYWLPALAQTRWLEVGALLEGSFAPRVAPLATFVQLSPIFDYAAQSERLPVHPLPLFGFLILCAAALALVRLAWRRDPLARPLGALFGLSLASIFMMLDISEPFWHAFRNPLAFFQFPWRFMTLVGFAIAICAAIVLRRHTALALALAPLVIAASTLGLRMRPLQDTASDEMAMGRFDFRVGQIGTTWTAEYMPLWVHAERMQIPRGTGMPVSDRYPAPADLSLVQDGYTLRRFRVQGDTPSTVRLHQFYLPQWRASLDGQALPTYPSSALGLLTVDLPPVQNGLLEFNYDASIAERLGIIVSVAAAGTMVALTRSRRVWALCLLSLALGAGWILWRGTNWPPVQPVNARFEQIAELLAVRVEPAQASPGESVRLTLFWQARGETRENLRAFVHAVAAGGGRILAQSDTNPGFYTPTSQWRTGEVIEDRRTLVVPMDAPPGDLQFFAGLYRTPPPQNLPAVRDGNAIPDGRVAIGAVRVSAR